MPTYPRNLAMSQGIPASTGAAVLMAQLPARGGQPAASVFSTCEHLVYLWEGPKLPAHVGSGLSLDLGAVALMVFCGHSSLGRFPATCCNMVRLNIQT